MKTNDNVVDINKQDEPTDEDIKQESDRWFKTLFKWLPDGELSGAEHDYGNNARELRLIEGGKITLIWGDDAWMGAVIPDDVLPITKAELKESWPSSPDDFIEVEPWNYGAACAELGVKLALGSKNYELKKQMQQYEQHKKQRFEQQKEFINMPRSMSCLRL